MRTKFRNTIITVVALVLALSACSASEDESHDDDDHHEQGHLVVTGTVIDVEGDLSAITSITLLTEDGEQMDFVPAPDALFDGGPVSHIRDHLVSGAPVHIEYEEREDGTLVAIELEDAHE